LRLDALRPAQGGRLPIMRAWRAFGRGMPCYGIVPTRESFDRTPSAPVSGVAGLRPSTPEARRPASRNFPGPVSDAERLTPLHGACPWISRSPRPSRRSARAS
jgi:hypothetical protein